MIHPSAIVDPSAEIHESVSVGPFAVIGPDVSIDQGTTVASHVVINGHTTIGKYNTIYQFASIGEANQDKKYAAEPTQTIIGDNNVFRECCTVHRGTVQDDGITQIGSDNLVMCYSHIAHDVKIGNKVILANNTTLAGHVHVGDWVILGGFAMVHQFVHIGAHAFSAINSIILKDVPPYVMVEGRPAAPRTINSEGLKRRGFSSEAILSIKRAFKSLYRKQLSLEKALEEIADETAISPELGIITEFVETSTRGIIR